MKLQFLGATGTVTGSKYLIENEGKRLLIDCGLYQGIKNNRLRNWKPLAVPPSTIDAVVLTHAHIDHSGYLPALVAQGFKGRIYCTQATFDLCKVLLPDSGYLQEEDARYANLRKFSKHSPAKPLYTEAQARQSLAHFQVIESQQSTKLVDNLSVTLQPAGHILGASSVLISNGGEKIFFSGDVGRSDDLIMYPPAPVPEADFIVTESTYGDRLHQQIDTEAVLEDIINRTVQRGGTVLMPAFAVGRAQTMMYIVQQLMEQNRIPNLPVYLNSPMAISATEIFCHHHKQHRLDKETCHKIDRLVTYVKTQEESIALNNNSYPAVIISASGMASGGRVLHHLKTLAPNSRNSIVFLGYQAPGTRGANIIGGAESVKIHGQYVPIKAEVVALDSLSAHADCQELMSWLATAPKPPKHCFITHGEANAADALRHRIKNQLGWEVSVPEYLDSFEI